MDTQADQNKKMAILSLSFGNRMKIAWQLTKPRLIPYFLFFLVLSIASLIAMGIPIFLMESLSPVFVILLPFPLVALLFITVGFYSSILRFMEGQESSFQINTFFEPFHRWKTLLPTLLIFGLVYMLIQIVFGLFSLIPILGGVINLLAMIVMTIATTCYFFYMAEHKNASMGKLLSTPPTLILPHMSRWMGAIGGAILAYLPLFVLTIIFVVTLLTVDSGFFDELYYGYEYDYYGYESSGMGVAAALGLILVAIFICFCGFIAYIFSSFLFAIAYKQSLIAQELMPPKTADPFGQPNQFTPNNPFGQANQFGQNMPNQTSQPGQPGYPEQAGYPGQAGQPGYPGQAGYPEQTQQFGHFEQGQPNQPAQPAQPTQEAQPNQDAPQEKASAPDQTGEFKPPSQPGSPQN